jgi:hypothetical protein
LDGPVLASLGLAAGGVVLLGASRGLARAEATGAPTAARRTGHGSDRSGEADAEQAPAVLPIDDEIDLHGFAPRDVVSVVDSYLEAAHERGLREVRLIHGRGKGVQRARVQARLAGHPLVERFADAPPFRGGWGATIAWLIPRAPDRGAPED